MSNKQKKETGPKPGYRETVRRAVMEMDIPAYVLLDMPRLELTGDGRLLIERHHGILEYNDTCIRVASKEFVICITGMKLELEAMTSTELSISGMIGSIELRR